MNIKESSPSCTFGLSHLQEATTLKVQRLSSPILSSRNSSGGLHSTRTHTMALATRPTTQEVALVKALKNGKPITAVNNINGGIVSIPENGCADNVLILNNGGHVYFTPSPSPQPQAKPAPKEVRCKFCKKSFKSEDKRKQHSKENPRICEVHGMCFDNWQTHVVRHSHTKCPRSKCNGRKFLNDGEFMRHWRKYHLN